MSANNFQIAFWICSLLFVACGLIVTIVGWHFTTGKARELAFRKDVHESIDKALAALKELEDSTYDFWIAAKPDTFDYSLVVKHKRLLAALKQVSALRSISPPTNEIIQLRRHATLDSETAQRPIKYADKRIKQFSSAATKVIESELLMKSWR